MICPSEVKIEDGSDAVYRVATASHYGAAELEWDLIFRGAKSFYKDKNSLLLKRIDAMTFKELGVSAPRTIN